MIGLTPFLALPLLARGESAVVWGDATTLEGWWWLVSGRIYRPNVFNHDVWARFSADPLLLLWQFRIVGWIPLLFGLWWSRRQTWPFALTALLYIIYAYGYDTDDFTVFMLPAFLLLTVPLAVGVREFGRNYWLILLIPILFAVDDVSLHGDMAVRERATMLLAELPDNAVALTPGDRTIFTLWYLQEVEDSRPDVVVVDENLFAFEWYRERLARLHPELKGLAVDDVAGFAAVNGKSRPICATSIDPTVTMTCQ